MIIFSLLVKIYALNGISFDVWCCLKMMKFPIKKKRKKKKDDEISNLTLEFYGC